VRRLVSTLLLCSALTPCLRADVPIRVEELIYSLTSFTGSGYSSSFALQTTGRIYLQAGVDNFISLRRTLVYWWPITAEWKTDTDSLNQPFTGTLELRSSSGTRRIPLERYTYFSPAGEPEGWKVATGPDADAEVACSAALNDANSAALAEYQRKSNEYDTRVESLGARIAELKRMGRAAAAAVSALGSLTRPAAPPEHSVYRSPPEPVQEGFILNLPAGEYGARFVVPDGTTLEGSDKKVVVYIPRRTGGVGFEVIPGDKWTRPEESKTPSSVLYVNGSTDLYLRPFLENEVNDLAYEKTLSNQSTGNPSVNRWVRVRPVTGARIELAGPDGVQQVAEQAFAVEQAKGTGLGYTIVPLDPQAAGNGQAANLSAFHIVVPHQRSIIRIRARDGTGTTVPGSQREIRVVVRSALRPALAGLAALPMVLLLIARGVRARRTRA